MRREYLAVMDEDQIDRYEAFRRSSLQKASMRKVIACTLLVHVTQKPSLHVLNRLAWFTPCAYRSCARAPCNTGITSVSNHT